MNRQSLIPVMEDLHRSVKNKVNCIQFIIFETAATENRTSLSSTK